MEYFSEKDIIRRGNLASSDGYHHPREEQHWHGNQLYRIYNNGIFPTIPLRWLSHQRREEFEAAAQEYSERQTKKWHELYNENTIPAELFNAFETLRSSERQPQKDYYKKWNDRQPDVNNHDEMTEYQNDAEAKLTEQAVLRKLDMQFADSEHGISFPLFEIEDKNDIYRLIGQTKYLSVAHHPVAVRLWLYMNERYEFFDRRCDANEPERLLIISPEHIRRSPENERAFEELTKHFKVIFDERKGDGFDYDIVVEYEEAYCRPHMEIPLEIAWKRMLLENSMYLDYFRNNYTIPSHTNGQSFKAERDSTYMFYKMFKCGNFAIALVSALLDEDEQELLNDIVEKSHDKSYLGYMGLSMLIEQDNLSEVGQKILRTAETAYLAWFKVNLDEYQRLVLDAIAMNADMDEITELMRQAFRTTPNGMKIIDRILEHGENIRDVIDEIVGL